jgi:hypothetical protein
MIELDLGNITHEATVRAANSSRPVQRSAERIRAAAAIEHGNCYRLGQSVKWNVLVIKRQNHQPRVLVPPSILANPRRPGWRVRSGFSSGKMTS